MISKERKAYKFKTWEKIWTNEIKLKNFNVLDLYSGVGSFGLECLPRGAKKVFFIEKHNPTLEILKKNIKTLNCEKKCGIIENDVTKLKNFSEILNQDRL